MSTAALRGRSRVGTTSLHRRAKRSDLSASCYEEAERSDLSQWLMEASCKHAAPETNLYFYHPDHLGSSSFITDATGYAVQHLQPACRSFGAGRYLPFGEPKRLLALSSRTPLKIISECEQTFVDQQNGYDSRYTFSAKEKDDETSYSYFGARYYDSDLSVWLSVDPMADKYPSMSAYMYCAGNPVMLVDPDGRAHGDPPFTVHYYTDMNCRTTNRVVAEYVDANNRRGSDAMATGIMGLISLLAPEAKYGTWVTRNYLEIFEYSAGFIKAIQNADWSSLCVDPGFTFASDFFEKMYEGNNKPTTAEFIKAFNKTLGAAFTISDIYDDLTSPPTRDEQLAELTYKIMAEAGLGKLNPNNHGVFNFDKKFNGRLSIAKEFANKTYGGVDKIFKYFDFSNFSNVRYSIDFVEKLPKKIINDSMNAF